MPLPADLAYVVVFAVVLPLWDAFVFWPAFRRQAQRDPAWARLRLWRLAIACAWLVVAGGAGLWVANDRSWATLGFVLPRGWRLWAAIALIALVVTYYTLALASLTRSAAARESARRQIGTLTTVLPRTRTEMGWFGGVSLTAGFCEEFLYRAYLPWVFTPWLGGWGAAALSLACFALGHGYQGKAGVLRTSLVGALYTGVVVLFGSLWPAIALHVLLDLGSGLVAYLVLREDATARRKN